MNIPAPTEPTQPLPRPAGIRQRDESARPDTIRSFAWFGYKGDEWIEDPQELGKRAWADALSSLADLAEDEDWEGTRAGDRHLPILDSYVRYTYQRLAQEQKVQTSANGEYAALNTGLLSKHDEDIFALFQRNDHPGAQAWKFRRWATDADREIMLHFEPAPDMASYVASSADLVYDTNRELRPAYTHILDDDHLDRFPPEFASLPARARKAQLDNAIALTIKRTRRNFKIVVPEWYPKTQEAGFLLPLDLLGQGSADVALVASAVGESAYRGHTVLTLEMAYTNARLVSRPDSDWLRPQAMPASADEQDA